MQNKSGPTALQSFAGIIRGFQSQRDERQGLSFRFVVEDFRATKTARGVASLLN